MSRDEMSALQGKRLNKLVNLVYHNVPFYRNKMQEMDLSPDDIQTIEDIVKLPFTTKQDLRDNYPYGLQAAPASEIVRVHASSGTTGNPTIVGYTRRDLSVWSEVMSRCLSAYGVTRNDTFLSVMVMDYSLVGWVHIMVWRIWGRLLSRLLPEIRKSMFV